MRVRTGASVSAFLYLKSLQDCYVNATILKIKTKQTIRETLHYHSTYWAIDGKPGHAICRSNNTPYKKNPSLPGQNCLTTVYGLSSGSLSSVSLNIWLLYQQVLKVMPFRNFTDFKWDLNTCRGSFLNWISMLTQILDITLCLRHLQFWL